MAMYVTFALKELGQNGITEEHKKRIHELLEGEEKEKVCADAALIPYWIMNIIAQAYE
jgi:hypothetical protein